MIYKITNEMIAKSKESYYQASFGGIFPKMRLKLAVVPTLQKGAAVYVLCAERFDS